VAVIGLPALRPYAFSYFSFEIPYYSQSLGLEKVGFPHLKVIIFQCFKYKKKRADSTVVLETLKNIDFHVGDFQF